MDCDGDGEMRLVGLVVMLVASVAAVVSLSFFLPCQLGFDALRSPDSDEDRTSLAKKRRRQHVVGEKSVTESACVETGGWQLLT